MASQAGVAYEERAELAINGFYWLIEGALAGSSRPGGVERGATGYGPNGEWAGWDATTTAAAARLDADLAWLRAQGVGAVLSLTETPLATEALARYQLTALHLPVDDMTAPTPEQFERALTFIDQQRGQGRGVVVHCKMGQGRTGAVLAAYLIRGGTTAEGAVRELRAICPGAICAPEQERALRAFAQRRDWIV